MSFKELLIGKTIESIEGGNAGSERVTFYFTDGTAVTSYHSRDCCESVSINRVEGDVVALIGLPILDADETENSKIDPPECPEVSWTWTRQRIQTAAGEVTFVWLGESNGYYGETPYTQITHGKSV